MSFFCLQYLCLSSHSIVFKQQSYINILNSVIQYFALIFLSFCLHTICQLSVHFISNCFFTKQLRANWNKNQLIHTLCIYVYRSQKLFIVFGGFNVKSKACLNICNLNMYLCQHRKIQLHISFFKSHMNIYTLDRFSYGRIQCTSNFSVQIFFFFYAEPMLGQKIMEGTFQNQNTT